MKFLTQNLRQIVKRLPKFEFQSKKTVNMAFLFFSVFIAWEISGNP